MASATDPNRVFTRQQVEDLLKASIGKTLLEVDKAQLFIHHEGNNKVSFLLNEDNSEIFLKLQAEKT